MQRVGELVVVALHASDALGRDAVSHKDDPVIRLEQRLRESEARRHGCN